MAPKQKEFFSQEMENGQIDQPSNNITIEGNEITWDKEITYFAHIVDQNLTLKAHTDHILKKTNKCIVSLYSLISHKSKLSTKGKETIFKTIIRPIITYGSAVFNSMAKTHRNKLQGIQNKWLKIINQPPRRHSTRALHQETGIQTIKGYNQASNLTKLQEKFQHSDYELIRAINIT